MCLYRYTGRKEGNVLFNHALNTFYLRLYGIRHIVKYHSDSERGSPLMPHGILFLISSKGSFICTIPQHRIAHTTAFVNQSWSTGWNVYLQAVQYFVCKYHSFHFIFVCEYHLFHTQSPILFLCWGVVKQSFSHSKLFEFIVHFG